VATIAVSGSSGFVGRHLCAWLDRHGHEARSLRRQELDAGPLETLRGADALVHLAARAHVLNDPARDPYAEFFASNVQLTRRIAAACVVNGVRRLVFVSSAGVLGKSSPLAGFDDSSPAAPHDDYTRSKLAAEQMLLDEFADALEIVIVRPPLVYGPDAPGNVARIMRLALSGWILPVGGLDAPRSMISVRNLCDVLTCAAKSPNGKGLRILVADAEITSVARLTHAIAKAGGKHARIMRVPPAALAAALRIVNRQADLHRLLQPFVLRGSLAADELGWKPRLPFADEIAWSVAARGGRW